VTAALDDALEREIRDHEETFAGGVQPADPPDRELG
jgi:hypothetical protein